MPFDGKDVADVLRRARALIDSPEKWQRSAGVTRGRAFCILGAIWNAADDMNVPKGKAYRTMDFVCGERMEDWNDAPERTHADVMAAFDKAIALAEAGE